MNRQRILDSIAKNPNAPDRQIAKNLGLCVPEVREVRLGHTPAPVAETTPVAGGVPLRNLRVLPRKPAENAATHIRRLPKGKGFEPKVLSHEWGMSEETIRKHAKDLRCLKYVETSPDEWVSMVMSPETAASYHA